MTAETTRVLAQRLRDVFLKMAQADLDYVNRAEQDMIQRMGRTGWGYPERRAMAEKNVADITDAADLLDALAAIEDLRDDIERWSNAQEGWDCVSGLNVFRRILRLLDGKDGSR